MRIAFKLNRALLRQAHEDLARPHPFAAERVGFFTCRVGALGRGGWVILANEYHSVADDDYLDDPTVGAMMGPAAIRKAMQVALNQNACMFHVHIHAHRGKPRPSPIDLSESAKFVPDFFHVCPAMVHGHIVLSLDSMAGRCWHPGARAPLAISDFTVVGWPMWLRREGR